MLPTLVHHHQVGLVQDELVLVHILGYDLVLLVYLHI